MQKLIIPFGWIGFFFGLATMVSAMLPGWGGPVAMLLMLPGFLFSSIYVLFSSRYGITAKWFNPGYLGMLMSSTPLLLTIYFQLTK